MLYIYSVGKCEDLLRRLFILIFVLWRYLMKIFFFYLSIRVYKSSFFEYSGYVDDCFV